MKKLNPIYFIMAVMLIAGLFLVGRSFYRIYNRQPLVVETQKVDAEAQQRMAEVRSQDLDVLAGAAEKSPAEVAKSLRRLQRQSAADAPEYITQFITSENDEIKGAALEAAAALSLDEYEGLIRSATKNPNREIRISVIRGLGNVSNEFSRSVTGAHWARGIQDPQERLVTLLTLQRVAKEPEEREAWQNTLVKELRSFRGDEQPTEWVEAFKSLPANDSLLEGAWKLVQNPEPTEVSFRALLYLRDFAGPEALKSNLGSVGIPAHRRYQLALIDLLFDHCPTGWNQLVKKIMTGQPHPMVKKGLQEAELSVKCI